MTVGSSSGLAEQAALQFVTKSCSLKEWGTGVLLLSRQQNPRIPPQEQGWGVRDALSRLHCTKPDRSQQLNAKLPCQGSSDSLTAQPLFPRINYLPAAHKGAQLLPPLLRWGTCPSYPTATLTFLRLLSTLLHSPKSICLRGRGKISINN